MNKQMEVREMGAMRILGAIVVLVLAGGVWGQGSKTEPVSKAEAVTGAAEGIEYPPGEPAQTAMVPVGSSAWSGTVFVGGKLGKHVRVRNFRPGYRTVGSLEFVDERGNIVKRLRIPKDDKERVAGEPKVADIFPVANGRYVGVLQWTEESEAEIVHDFGDRKANMPKFLFLYLDVEGKELWRAKMCCAKTGNFEALVKISEDGSVVAILDVSEGDACGIGDHDYLALSDCIGLRIYTAEGKEIHRARQADEVSVSSKGKYVIYTTEEFKHAYQFHVPSRKLIELPMEEGIWPGRGAADDGIVIYGARPGKPKYRHVPGKGLEKIGKK